MTKQWPCVFCGGDICGSIERIRLSICCSTCSAATSNPHNPEYGRCISKRQAMKRFNYTSQDLRSLWCTKKRNMTNANPLPIISFVYSEVTALRHLSHREKLELLRNRHKTRAEEQSFLQLQLGIDFSLIPPPFRQFLFDEYFFDSCASWMTYEEAKERCRLLPRIRAILKKCPLAAAERVCVFCQEHPVGGAVEFEELRLKEQRVFQLEAPRIFQHLRSKDREKLPKTILRDVYCEFLIRDGRRLIRQRLLERVDAETADSIMAHPACQLRLGRGGEEVEIAEKLAQFWRTKDHRNHRMISLRAALGISILDVEACPFSREYIYGEVDRDVMEVVTLVKLWIRLKEVGPVESIHHQTAVDNFCRVIFDERLDTTVAIDRVRRR